VLRVDPTDSKSLTGAEIEARRQIKELAAFFRAQVPGFENAYLQKIAPQLGVRESRRVLGDYVLTKDDLLETVAFENAVAHGSYSIDIHNPDGAGTVLVHIPKGKSYTIPYTSIYSRNITNLFIASRSISATHEAHSAIRVMPIVAAIGHAAGVAAHLAHTTRAANREVDYKDVQRLLIQQGAYL